MNPAALVTGASRGIGRAIALELARLGYDVVINFAGNAVAAEQTAADARAAAVSRGSTIQAELCQADIGKDDDRRRLVEFVRERFGRLDVLVNNAGITSVGRADLLEATEENFDRLMAVNLKGPYFLTQLVARWMIEQANLRGKAASDAQAGLGHPGVASTPQAGQATGTPARRFRIINISSISAYTVSLNRGDYCLAKAALGMMTRLFAARLADHGISVHEVCPGIIASDMTAPVRDKYNQLISEGLTPIRRWGEPADVARAVAAVVLDYLPFSTGEVIHVDGGFHLRRL